MENWSHDTYWTDAMNEYQHARDDGGRLVEIDLAAIEKVIFNDDGPAFRLLDAMSRLPNSKNGTATEAPRGSSWRC